MRDAFHLVVLKPSPCQTETQRQAHGPPTMTLQNNQLIEEKVGKLKQEGGNRPLGVVNAYTVLIKVALRVGSAIRVALL